MPSLQCLSLKTRVTLFTLAIFVASLWLLAFLASRMLREDMQRVLGGQQFSTVSFVAKEIGEHLGGRLQALEQVAGRMSPETLNSAGAMQATLEDQPVLAGLFSGGLFVTRADGGVVAEVPLTNSRGDLSAADREMLGPVLRESKATIGPPVTGVQPLGPVVGMAVPIRDARQGAVGALVGVVALQHAEFLDNLTQARYGTTGGLHLVTAKEHVIIAATDKTRILQPLATPETREAIDQLVAGREGPHVFVDPYGVEVLSSAKRLAVVDWYLIASMPTAEAFAPIRDMQQRMLLATVGLTLLAGALTWWMIKRQVSPMLDTVNALARLAAADSQPQPLPVRRQDEIGQLVKGFNLLLGKLSRREDALRESHAFVQGVLDSVPSQIAVIDHAGRIIAINSAWRRFSLENSATPGTMAPNTDVGANYLDVCASAESVGADDAGATREGIKAVIEGRLAEFRFEYPCHSPQEQRWFTMTATPLDSGVEGAVVVHSNITERRQLEEQVRQLAFYDSLTGLPNRRLVLDRLTQAIAASRRSGCHGAVLFIDLDDFKPVNDNYGHDAGDLLLSEAAHRLQGGLRETDTVARLGGDEFIVMVCSLDATPAVARAQAEGIARKLSQRLAEPYRLRRASGTPADRVIEHRCSASIGVTLFDGRNDDPESILVAADAAMYQAKASAPRSTRVAAKRRAAAG